MTPRLRSGLYMKETMLLSMGMSFFVSFPISNAQADPDKSEDRRGSWVQRTSMASCHNEACNWLSGQMVK